MIYHVIGLILKSISTSVCQADYYHLKLLWHFCTDGCHKFSLMMYHYAQWIKNTQIYWLVLLLLIVHLRPLNALWNSLIKQKDCWSRRIEFKCPLLHHHFEGLFVLKSLLYTRAQCKLDFWLAVVRRRTAAFTQRTVGLQKDCSVTDFKNAPRAPPGDITFLLLPRVSYHLNFSLPSPI